MLGRGQDWQRTQTPTLLSDISTAYDQGNSIAPTWRLIMTGPERFTRHQPRQTMSEQELPVASGQRGI